MPMSLNELQELTEKRTEWVQANQKNGFEKGLESLLSNMYPGKAHFIYELLQNSEDAGATQVTFALSESALVYEHDGPTLFSFSDIDSITGIGISTKADDSTQIGKFGVGFKSVYSYTQSPEIHSNGYHFRIERMVIPITEGVKKGNTGGKTIFKFPFNSEQKDPITAMKEIASGLNALNDQTLLFLRNIKKITFWFKEGCLNLLQSTYGDAIYGNNKGIIERVQEFDNLVTIKSQNTCGKSRKSDWLVFSETKPVRTSENESVDCRIAIAFATELSSENVRSIIPCNPGQVFVYFPAEKETSNLKFHIHAPFASTVARDSIHDHPDNEVLKHELVELFISSLQNIKDLHYLNASFLKVLPNSGTNLPPFYMEFRDRIRETLIAQPFIPCIDKSFECGKFVARGPIKVSKCLSNSDIEYIHPYIKIKKWMISPGFNEPEIDRLVQDLKIPEINVKALLSSMYLHTTDIKQARIEELIKMKSDLWLQDFYLLLEDEAKEYELKRSVPNAAMIRARDPENNILHIKPDKAFRPPAGMDEYIANVPFITKETMGIRNTPQAEKLNHFFDVIGVKEYSEQSLISHELGKFKFSVPASSHFLFIARCIKFLKENPTQIQMFRGKRVLGTAGIDASQLILKESCDLILDSPFLDTGLSILCPINGTSVLSSGYMTHPGIVLEDLIDFAKKIGVQTELSIVEDLSFSEYNRKELYSGYEYKKETSNKIKRDYQLPFLEEYIRKALTISTSKLVWKASLSAPDKVLQAKYAPNGKSDINTAPSTVVCVLKGFAWIPDKDGVFFKPADIKKHDLHPDFKLDYSNGLLHAINFGKTEEMQSIEYQKKTALVKSIGFENFEEAEQVVTVIKTLHDLGVSIPDFLSKTILNYQDLHAQHFPDNSVNNPDRRASKITERIAATPEKKYEKRERTVQVERQSLDARSWLKTLYTNDDEIMICQICKNPMPFDKRDGQPYFEAVELFTKDLLVKDFEATHLALCPTCSAKYQEYVKQDISQMEMIQFTILKSTTGSRDIPITLDPKTHGATIRFVGKHIFDLRNILQGLVDQQTARTSSDESEPMSGNESGEMS